MAMGRFALFPFQILTRSEREVGGDRKEGD